MNNNYYLININYYLMNINYYLIIISRKTKFFENLLRKFNEY